MKKLLLLLLIACGPPPEPEDKLVFKLPHIIPPIIKTTPPPDGGPPLSCNNPATGTWGLEFFLTKAVLDTDNVCQDINNQFLYFKLGVNEVCDLYECHDNFNTSPDTCTKNFKLLGLNIQGGVSFVDCTYSLSDAFHGKGTCRYYEDDFTKTPMTDCTYNSDADWAVQLAQ